MQPNNPQPPQSGQSVPSNATKPPVNNPSVGHAGMPQGHPAGEQPQPIAPAPPKPRPQQLPTQGASPAPVNTPAPPPPRKSGGKMKFIIIGLVVFLILAIVIGVAVFISRGGSGNPRATAEPSGEPGPKEHEATEFPEFEGVEITDDTVSFNKVNESFRIRYKDQIFHEQDTGKFRPREVFPVEEALTFDWYGLVNPPEDVDDGELFSFRAPPTYQSFIFIMRWESAQGELYQMHRFHDNKVSLLREFTEDRLFYVPVLDSFSLGGNFVSINLFPCATCFDVVPEVLLYEVSTGFVKNLGQVSYFAWGADDKSYEYREYKEGEPDSEVPVRRNEFFSESVQILDP